MRYRFGGKQRRITLGTYPEVSLADARDKARDVLHELDKGRDPEAVAKLAGRVAGQHTVTAVAERYITGYLPTRDRRTAGEIEQILRRDLLPVLGHRDIKSIMQRDIRDVVADVVGRARNKAERRERARAAAAARAPDASKWQRAGVYANRVQAVIRKLLNWAVEEQFIESNPAKFRATVEEKPRTRTLADEEIAGLWAACREVHPVYGSIVKLLLLTGQRLGEVASMRWSEVKLDTGEWRLPGSRTKNRREHIVPLPEAARAIAAGQLRTLGCEFVFSTNGKTAFSGFSKCKARLDKRLGFDTAFTLHDLRHTVATGMAELEVAPHVIEAVLNHASGIVAGIAGRYNTYSYLKEKRAALASWAERIEQVARSRTPAARRAA